MELMDAIKTRRAIRRIKPDPVPEDALDTVLTAIQMTPSWANTQCWEVVVVKNQAVKEQLAETLPEGNPALKAMTQAPIILVLCGIKNLAGFKKGESTTDKGDWFMFDVGAATQNASLAAHALGLGSVVVGLFDAVKAGEIVGVPEQVSVVALLPVGYPERIPSTPKRKDFKEFVWENHYKK